MLLYYVTDRRQFPGDERAQRAQLLAKIAEAARAGVDYIQLRERDLTAHQLEALAREAVRQVGEASASFSRIHAPAGMEGRGTRRIRSPRLLINSRTDIALAAGAHGVHLRSDDISASEARVIWGKQAGDRRLAPPYPVIGVSCHTAAEVRSAEAHGADFAVFAPVFEKTTAPPREGVGLEALRQACVGTGAPPHVEGVGTSRMPVLALGGITLENARACLDAGAAGIAAIRLFQDHEIAQTVLRLRSLAGAARIDC